MLSVAKEMGTVHAATRELSAEAKQSHKERSW